MTIDEWEANATQSLDPTVQTNKIISGSELGIENSRRILALIDLVRKKDEALKFYLDEIIYDPEILLSDKSHPPQSHWTTTAREALALTEKL